MAAWQELKEQGKLAEGGQEEEEEDIYAEARIADLQVGQLHRKQQSCPAGVYQQLPAYYIPMAV